MFRTQEMLGDTFVTDQDFTQLLGDVGDFVVLAIPLVCHALQIEGSPGRRVLLEHGCDTLGRRRFRVGHSNSLPQGRSSGPAARAAEAIGGQDWTAPLSYRLRRPGRSGEVTGQSLPGKG
ncbi:hypothetical protein ASD08_13900 [Streptomyces sp. Root369]|nr:hypothetical protein ASD08_13900 [Streptomyces sp. Root369]